jgi:hypothetical protein
MPMTVRLQTESGQVLKELYDLDDALLRLVYREDPAQLKIAHTIDQYGQTYLNCLQAPLLLEDLKKILSGGASQSEAEVLGRIADLARESLSEPHLYLRFLGD